MMVAQNSEIVNILDSAVTAALSDAHGWEFRASRLEEECAWLRRDLKDARTALIEERRKKREIAAECARLREVIAREVGRG